VVEISLFALLGNFMFLKIHEHYKLSPKQMVLISLLLSIP